MEIVQWLFIESLNMLQHNRDHWPANGGALDAATIEHGVVPAAALDIHTTATLIERSSALRAEKLTPGNWLGRYQILSRLATGGMAELYLARAEGAAGINKLVVIKRILPHLADDPKFVTMFLDEARLGTRLSHGNIAPVHEVGFDADTGSFFLAMEYVHGVELKTLLATHARSDQPLPVSMALSIGIQVAGALHYAHNLLDENDEPLGLVHRDVSLSNILVGFDGGVKVIDFGVAKAAITTETAARTIKGKFAYMSPEQCTAQGVDRRSDLFAVGIVLFEMTTMQRAYADVAGDFELLQRIVHGPAPLPSAVCREYPLELEAVIERALRKQPDERYQSAEELAEALENVAQAMGLLPSARELGAHVRKLFPNEYNSQSSSRLIGLAGLQAEYDKLGVTNIRADSVSVDQQLQTIESAQVPRFEERDLFQTIVATKRPASVPAPVGSSAGRPASPVWLGLLIGGAIGAALGLSILVLARLLS